MHLRAYFNLWVRLYSYSPYRSKNTQRKKKKKQHKNVVNETTYTATEVYRRLIFLNHLLESSMHSESVIFFIKTAQSIMEALCEILAEIAHSDKYFFLLWVKRLFYRQITSFAVIVHFIGSQILGKEKEIWARVAFFFFFNILVSFLEVYHKIWINCMYT